ncbi:MAG: mechanosensitive ion channel [Clostridia bacterium]|nr:mechanosensitive ion channel [Clostridia bacterium]
MYIFGHYISWADVWMVLKPIARMLAILIIGKIVIGILMRIIRRGFNKSKLDPSLIKYCTNTIKIIFSLFVILAALDSVGVSTSGVVAALSAATVAIGLALKDSLGNIASGILLLFSPRFVTGDYISTENGEGTVIEVSLMHTTLKTFDSKQVSIPNSLLMNNEITNYSREPQRRVDITFPIAYDADVENAKTIISEVLCAHKMVLSKPEKPFVRVHSYGDSAVNLAIRVWVKSENYWTVYFDITESVREKLNENGISIPFNQLDVHIKNEEK